MGNLPDWYTPEQDDPASAPPPAKDALPAWYTPEPPPQDASAPDTGSVGANIATGVAKIPGAVLGTPHMLVHTVDWAAAQGVNALTGKKLTGADVDTDNPLVAPGGVFNASSDDVDKLVFDVASLAAGHPVKPYVPQTPEDELGQAAVTGAGAGLVDPAADVGILGRLFSAAKGALATGAASVAHQAFPNSNIAPILAALLTHASLNAGGKTAAAGYNKFAKPFVQPTTAGEQAAARGITQAGPTPPTLANPSAVDLLSAQNDVQNATSAVGAGLLPDVAMGGMRDQLAATQGGLKNARDAQVAPFYAAFRGEPPLTPEQAAPLGRIVDPRTLQTAVRGAATDMRNSGKSPFAPYTDFNVAGDPVYRGGALTPDLLDRTKTKLNAMGSAAENPLNSADAQEGAALKSAAGSVTDFLDQQFPNTYPQARAAYADASKPLVPFKQPAVADTLRQNTDALGKPISYVVPDGALFDRIAAAKDPGTVVRQFIDAAGDKNSVLGPLQDALVGRLRDKGVIDPTTGEINPKAYSQEVSRYMPTLKMFLPQLGQKFGDAITAQNTLDNVRAQGALATDVASGGLRDATGLVTADSANRWLVRNRAQIEATQPAGSFMRLQSLAQSLPADPTAAANAALEAAPMVIGGMLGGSEGGVLGGITHNIPRFLANPEMAKYRAAYNDAVEHAFLDPAEAQRLSALGAKYRGVSSRQAMMNAVRDTAKQSLLATPAAVIAGGGAQQ